jgi:hypothetical protein
MANANDDQRTNIESDQDERPPIEEAPQKEEAPARRTDPKLGEDPGLLPLTEDPRERRLKRKTM